MRIAVGLEYDGSKYCGWQRQSHSPSVQEEVEKALSKVANSPITVFCAGRTDTAVHGQEQVIHFDTEAIRPEHAWRLGANTYLPDDIALRWVKFVDDSFHARFSAFSRRYRYVILNQVTRSALLAGKVVIVRNKLDVERMSAAAAVLLGMHDFTSFRGQGCQAKHPNRNVISVAVTREKDFIYFDIVANAFLLHMVRNIAGVLIAIGKGEKPVEWVDELLRIKDRTQAGVTAPPNGLYLVKIKYPEKYQLPELENIISFG